MTIEAMAEDARALLDAAGWASAHVVGHSYGGLLALTLARRSPARVLSIAPLVDVFVCLHTPSDFRGVGQFYRDFAQVEDAEVVRLLALNPPVKQAPFARR